MTSTLSDLQAASTRRDLADILKIPLKAITHQVYATPNDLKYRSFEIPKKGGGGRPINAPNDQLKSIQAELAKCLYECVEEIEEKEPHRKSLSHGFTKGRSIISNTIPHVSRRYVLNLDLENFFGEINFGRVRGFFLKDREFSLHPVVATFLAQIACHDNQLPQGSPSSPVISNLILRMLDVRLAAFAAFHSSHYTRYADDLTFSSNRKTFPQAIAKRAFFRKARWKLSKQLRKEVEKAGFEITDRKTRMQIRGSRQEVTGVTCNEKLNVSQTYYRTTRAMCHSLFQSGLYHDKRKLNENGDPRPIENTAPLEGRLSYIYNLKARRDRDFAVNEMLSKRGEFSFPHGTKKLYQKFLRFKYFVNLPQPLVLTEGKTDITYLKCALRARKDFFGSLYEAKGDELVPILRYLAVTGPKIDLLDMAEGSSGLAKLVGNYKNIQAQYNHKPRLAPVILLVDNDQGGGAVFSAAKKHHSVTIRTSDKQLWFKIFDNLYILKTPPKTVAPHDSEIEDLFPDEVKRVELEGKTLSLEDGFDTKRFYGKSPFADKVVRAVSDNTKFAGFDVILRSIEEIVEDFKA